MLNLALNHVTAPGHAFEDLVALAQGVGCVGVEVRNDLARPLFDGLAPEAAREHAVELGIRILAIAEVQAFDDGSERALEAVNSLAHIARAAGAFGVALIPRNDGSGPVGTGALGDTLGRFAAVLEQTGVTGLIEPLGFASASLQFKAQAVEAIESLDLGHCFGLVHDTFHHTVAGEEALFAAHTKAVHVSGVINASKAPSDYVDADRVLVDHRDLLGTVRQVRALQAAGYNGPVSVEAFSPTVQTLAAPQAALLDTFHTLQSGLSATAA